MKRYLAYYRVSTQKQGKSGLGLEAQKSAVEGFVKGEQGTILKAYTEVETGKSATRPQLTQAIAHARMAKATLLIAKMDRLARNVAFLSSLMESGVDFKAVDNPCADKFTVHILACVAEKEARDISARTIAALNAYKARGGLLGSSRPECKNNLNEVAADKGRKLAAVARHEKAQRAYADLLPTMQAMRSEGLTYRAIAAKLNEQGFTSQRGNPFSHVQVRLVLERAEKP